MSLPIPNLDDRRFQDLVDDAKRMVQQRCPEWTDHNVSDPGVTLIETFAFMTDELLYRLNRVPDRMYITFLDLLGVSLHAPTPARVDVTAWLSAPPEEVVVVPAKAEVATIRTSQDDAVVFATTQDLVMPPHSLRHVFTQAAGGQPVSRDDELSLVRPSSRASRRSRRTTTPSSSASTTPRPAARSRSGSSATCRASAWTRPRHRWCGRRGTARRGSAATSTATRPAASTGRATSSSTCPPATRRR